MALDLERAVAKLLCVGFDGTEPPEEFLALLRRGASGIILFARNLGPPPQMARLCARLKDAVGRPLLTSIDHEGGHVVRIRDGFSTIPAMREIGKSNDIARAREIGKTMGRELRAVNIDLDFAPVMDVDTNPANPVIGDRSFGDDPALVAKMGVAVIEGLQSQSVAACAKHFPGHGDTHLDSHIDLPSLPHDLPRLRKIELPPFEAAIKAGVTSIMTAHVIFRALDAEYPATMSKPVLDGLLRKEFGFEGVIISDDLEMKAIADHYGVANAIVRGANAGVDLFLVCHTLEQQNLAIDALVNAVKSGDVKRERIEEAGRRIDALMTRFCKPPA
ncbi:beta-N-acetylhexosaminidase [soil metagenome]